MSEKCREEHKKEWKLRKLKMQQRNKIRSELVMSEEEVGYRKKYLPYIKWWINNGWTWNIDKFETILLEKKDRFGNRTQITIRHDMRKFTAVVINLNTTNKNYSMQPYALSVEETRKILVMLLVDYI